MSEKMIYIVSSQMGPIKAFLHMFDARDYAKELADAQDYHQLNNNAFIDKETKKTIRVQSAPFIE